MKTIIFTKQGKQVIDLEDPWTPPGSPIYQAIVNYFDNWINNANAENQAMYFEPCEEIGGTYLDWKGAIEMGLDVLIEHLKDNNITRTNTKVLCDIDLEGVFQA